MADVAGALATAGLCIGAYIVWDEHQRKQRMIVINTPPPTKTKPDNPRRNLGEQLFGMVLGIMNDKLSGGASTERSTGTPAQVPQYGGKAGADGQPIGERLLLDLMSDFGLTRPQAAGVVGNLDHETGGFKSMQEIKPVVPGSRGGFGYAQWTGPRRREFEAWASARGLDLRSYEANYGFLKHELTFTPERRVLTKLKRANNHKEAATVFSGSSQRGNSWDGFLRPGIPHLSSRIRRAAKYV